MNAKKLYVACLAVMTFILVSGCICCCGLDGQLSKFKKPVSAISFPADVTVGGKTYHRVYSNEYLTPDAVKAGVVSYLGLLGYPAGNTRAVVSQYVDTAGVEQYKSFKYTDGTAGGTFAGLVAKTGSPLTAMSGYTGLKSTADASLPQANNPSFNWGKVRSFSYGGPVSHGDGGDWYQFKADGQDCYGVALRYSNMYVCVYSFESAGTAQEAARLAIAQIDAAA